MSNSLWPYESQHARPRCPSPTPGVHPNSHPLSRWCHPAISSSVVPFSSCSQALPASVFSNESTLRMRWPKSKKIISSIKNGNTAVRLLLCVIIWRTMSKNKILAGNCSWVSQWGWSWPPCLNCNPLYPCAIAVLMTWWLSADILFFLFPRHLSPYFNFLLS